MVTSRRASRNKFDLCKMAFRNTEYHGENTGHPSAGCSNGLTPKQESFCLAYLETGNAAEAYRRAYNATNMAQRTIEKRASELLRNGAVAAKLENLRVAAAEKAVLSRAWVLERLQRNARIALGEERVTVTHRTKDGDLVDKQVIQRDAAAANRALELLGKTQEVRMFCDRLEASGKDSAPLAPEPSNRDIARAILHILHTAHLERAPESVTARLEHRRDEVTDE